MHAIARLFEPLLRVSLPATGRHRPTQVPPSCGGMAPGGYLRPYVLTEAERAERRRQRHRRCALSLATQGIDAGPRRIHGMEVAAR